MEVAGANRRWRFQFRYRGSRHESAFLLSRWWYQNIIIFPMAEDFRSA